MDEPNERSAGSEESLVALARLGSEHAVRALVKKNSRRLFRMARSVLHDDGEAEDAVQEAYAKAFAKLDTFRGESRFSTWLIRITLNEAIARKRRRRPTVGLEELELAALDGEGSLPVPPLSIRPLPADSALVRGEVRAALDDAIGGLPPSFRAVLVVRDIEGLNVEEAADMLGLNPTTVRTRLHRARRLVRAAIGSHVSDVFPFARRESAATSDGCGSPQRATSKRRTI